MIFLLHYERNAGLLRSVQRYADEARTRAEQDRLELEIELLGSKFDNEVVLLEAENEESLRKTHARYFETLDDLWQSSGLVGNAH